MTSLALTCACWHYLAKSSLQILLANHFKRIYLWNFCCSIHVKCLKMSCWLLLTLWYFGSFAYTTGQESLVTRLLIFQTNFILGRYPHGIIPNCYTNKTACIQVCLQLRPQVCIPQMEGHLSNHPTVHTCCIVLCSA